MGAVTAGLGQVGLARLRQGLYRFIAAGLLPPDRERIASLAAASAFIQSTVIEGFAFATWWRPLTSVLARSPSIDCLLADYVRLFEAGVSEPPCPLVERAYIPLRHGPGALHVDLEREYRRLGIAANPHDSRPPDHAVVQLEAMALLCAREDEAANRGDASQTAHALGDEERFLERHLARWFPIMARRGAMIADSEFYGGLLTAGRAFVHHDRYLVAALVGSRALEALA